MIDFGPQDGPQEGAPEIDFRAFLGSWSHLGAKMAPRPPQEPPRPLQDAPRTPQDPPKSSQDPLQEAPRTPQHIDFGRFWATTGWMLAPNSQPMNQPFNQTAKHRRHGGGLAEGSWIYIYIYICIYFHIYICRYRYKERDPYIDM